MRILYIDTSSSFLYSAIYEDEKIICEIKKEFGQNLSEESLPEISKLFEIAKIKPNDINKIIVVNGPGSFTGIRIGVTIAKIFAWSLNIEIITISSLEAMSISCDRKCYKVPMLDARRKYVYAGIYDENNKEIFKPKHILIEEFNKELEKLGDYQIISNDEFDMYNNIYSYDPKFAEIIKIAKDKKDVNPHAVNPDYLKLTEAEESQLK